MAERTHHQYGPSTLDACSKCVRFKYYDSDAGAASEGEMLHSAVETGCLDGLDDEQKLAVEAVRNYTESLKFEDGHSPADWLDLPEHKVALEGLTYGRADRILFCPKSGLLHVVDYKFTRADSSHGMQLRTYAAAFIETWNASHQEADRVRRVVTHIAAPRLGEPEIAEYCDPEALVADVRGFLERLYARIEDPFEPPTPDESVCPKCARAARCPRMGTVAVAAARGLGLPMPEVFAPDALVSVRDRAIAQVLAGALENWSEQIKKNNAEFVASGGSIPGYRQTTRSTGLRVPKNKTAAALKALRDDHAFSEDELLGCCSLVIGDVVEMVALAKGITGAEAKECVRERLADNALEGSCTFLQKEKRITDGELLGRIVGQ